MDSLRDLLGLYYQPNETVDQRTRHIALFVKDLADMSDDAVGWAIQEWRRTQDRRPSPASLRQLCMMRRHEASEQTAGRRPPDPAPYGDATIGEEERARREAIVAKCAKASGFVQTKHGQWTLPSEAPEAKRVPHWSETAAPTDPRFIELRRARRAAGIYREV